MDKIIKSVLLEDLPDRNDLLFKLLVPTISLVFYNNFEKEKFRSSTPPVRNNDYFEFTIPKYSLDEFRAHFRMSRTCFEKLLRVVTNSAQPCCKHVFPAKKLLLTIWILSKQESFLSVSDRFGMAPSTGHYIFMETIEAIRKLKRDYIKFPNSEEQKVISDIYESKCRIPGIVGAIDGCHIPVKQPQHNPIDFYNRKGFHSIVLQGVCDHTMRFIDVFIGIPGRVHDAKVFRCSPLFKILESEESPIKQEYPLMGNSAYGASSFMITPFKDIGHLTKQKPI